MTMKTNTTLAASALALLIAAPALADSSAELEHRVDELTKRLAELESNGGGGLSFGNGGTIDIYGYVKADFIQDLDSDLGTTTFGLGSLVPGAASDENFQAHAFQSRLGVRGSSQSDIGDIGFQLEGDFFGDGGGGFRLRHANATLGNWLVGQTWTNFMQLNAFPGTLDFQGPAGLTFARQTQVRYTQDFGQQLSASFSVEDAAFDSSDPIATAALDWANDRFTLRGAVLYGTLDTGSNEVDAWGASIGGTAKLWEGGGLSATYTRGEAIAGYFQFGGDGYYDDGGTNRAVETEGASLGVTHAFNDKWSIGTAYGYRRDDAGVATGTRSLETVHFNVNYAPVENVSVGLEYFTGERELFDGSKADADRIQASVQFNF